jgi:hypothetical protein
MDHTTYFRHLVGLTALMAWLKRWERIEGAPVISGGEVRLSAVASQRVGFGVPRQPRYGRTPFLAIQPEERDWMELLNWGRAFLVPDQNTLVLTSPGFAGDHERLADLPAVALGIAFDEPAKLAILEKSGQVCLRGLNFETDEQTGLATASVEGGAPWLSLSLTPHLDDQWLSPAERSHGHSFGEMLERRIQASNREINPGYLGAPSAVSQQFRDLVDTFNPESIKKVTDRQSGV